MFKANCSGDGSLGHVWMIYYIFNTGKYKVQVCKNSKKKKCNTRQNRRIQTQDSAGTTVQ